jgi:hypothetical protein
LQYIPIFFAEPAFKELGFRALAPLRSASVGAGPSSRGGSNFTWRKNVEKYDETYHDMAVCQNLVPLVNIKIAGKWMFIPLKMVLIGIDP